jgi:hypothetical protein
MDTTAGDRRFHAAGAALLVAILAGWLALSALAVQRQGSWADEAAYIIKSWWYVSGAVKPYSAEDATWYQPLFYCVTGAWQWIAGHGVVATRALTVLITGGNIALLAWLLRRLGCGVWPVAAAVVIFALTEDGIFYFSSASPYALAVCLQLITFHLLLSMNRSASVPMSIAFGVTLTAVYLLRINLVFFIALALSAAWLRAGKDRWRPYICAAAIFAVTWSLLALLWGHRFVYISLYLPGLTDLLVRVGLLPDLYPNLSAFSSRVMIFEYGPGFSAWFDYVFGWEMLRDWILGHHVLPIAASLLAIIVAAVSRYPQRGWTLFFALSYWAMLLYHHLGSQSFCAICVQVYANYFDYMAALAGGLALQGLLQPVAGRPAQAVAICTVAVLLAGSAIQSWSLTGVNRLPSIRNRTSSLSREVDKTSETLKALLPRDGAGAFVGTDVRIPLALTEAGIRFPPVMLSMSSYYRKLNEDLSQRDRDNTIAEITDLTMWTDVVARGWIENDYDWLVVQRQPARFVPWLIWTPNAPLIVTALEKCFERFAAPEFGTFEPPLSVDLYKRIRRGTICLGE